MLESFWATLEWLHTLWLPWHSYFTCNFEEHAFRAHLLGIFQRDVHSFIILCLREIKPSMSASECQCWSDWAFSWNLVSSISCAWCRHETAAEDAAHGSAIVDASGAASSVLFVGSVRPVYCVAAVWVNFKFVFVFPDSCVSCQSASSVCVSLHQQWPSHWALQQMQVVSLWKKG